MLQDQPDVLDDVRQTAEWTGLPVSWWYAQAEAGNVPHLKVGKYLGFRRTEIAAWLEAQRRGPRVAAR